MVLEFQWPGINATVTSTTTTRALLRHFRKLSADGVQTAGKSWKQGQPMKENTSSIDLVFKCVALGVAESLLGQPPQPQQ